MDPTDVSEVINDIDSDLTIFWSVLRDPALFPEFERRAAMTPFSEIEFGLAEEAMSDRNGLVVQALAFFIRCRQSMAGMGKSFAPITTARRRRGMNEQVSAWLGAVDGLADVHARLARVLIRCTNAPRLVQQLDSKETLFYSDPTYLPKTRTAKKMYRHEMTEADHEFLLKTFLACKGKVMISGYASPMYSEMLKGWTVHRFDLPNNMSTSDAKDRESEVIWCNW